MLVHTVPGTGTTLASLNQNLPASQSRERNPAAVYLASLAPRSQRVQAGALATVADILGNVPGTGIEGERRSPYGDVLAVPWHQLHYQHMQAIRTQLAQRYAPATANRILAALRGVLKEAWRLGLMDAETYHAAVDVQAVRGFDAPTWSGPVTGRVSGIIFGVWRRSGASWCAGCRLACHTLRWWSPTF